MFKYHYKVRLSTFFYTFIPWLLWTIIFLVLPSGPFRAGPESKVLVIVFLPLGIAILSSLSGYKLELHDGVLRFGSILSRRKISLYDIKDVQRGGKLRFSLWNTSDSFTLITRKEDEIIVPCNNANEILDKISPLLHRI